VPILFVCQDCLGLYFGCISLSRRPIERARFGVLVAIPCREVGTCVGGGLRVEMGLREEVGNGGLQMHATPTVNCGIDGITRYFDF